MGVYVFESVNLNGGISEEISPFSFFYWSCLINFPNRSVRFLIQLFDC